MEFKERLFKHTGTPGVLCNYNEKVPIPISSEDAASIIAGLGQWTVHTPGVADILEAVNIQQKYQLSFWDYLIVCSAQKLSCEILWSEDLHTGQTYNGVFVRNPFAGG
jgi:predicted nucleic acid-binding protein